MARDNADRHRSEASSDGGFDLAGCFARAKPILQALVASVAEGDSLAVATDQNGFPVAQRIVSRPNDLPDSAVIGRHNRCALTIPNDNRVSLRHILLTAWPGKGPTRFRGYDLGGRAGVVLADGKRVSGFSAQGQLALSFGNTAMFILPGGAPGANLLEGEADASYQKLTGLDPTGRGTRLAVSTMAHPGVAEIGGYRPRNVDAAPLSRGVLRLRSTKGGRGGETRELDVDNDQLQRGLLIGRYSDRCSLAGAGRNLSRVHALVAEEGPTSLLVYDLASTNGVRPDGQTEGPSHAVVRVTSELACMLGHFELRWVPGPSPAVH